MSDLEQDLTKKHEQEKSIAVKAIEEEMEDKIDKQVQKVKSVQKEELEERFEKHKQALEEDQHKIIKNAIRENDQKWKLIVVKAKDEMNKKMNTDVKQL